MTRYARAGKGSHQRVAKESTDWNELKPPPPERVRGSKTGDGRKPFRKKERFSKQKAPEGGADQSQSNEASNNSAQNSKTFRGPAKRSMNSNIRGFGQSKSVKIFGQFWVPLEDAKRMKNLLKKLKDQGLSRKEISEALKNDRRKAEKAAKRQRDKTCFQCRQFGHVLSDCPNLKKFTVSGSGNEDGSGSAETSAEICFKCGSTEHTSRHCRKKGEKFSFAKCFICSGTGHIARQCPQNTKGIYPSGGSCGECGSTSHLKKDCPDMVVAESSGPKTDGDDDAVTLRIQDPFSSTEYEPMSTDPQDQDDNDNEDVSTKPSTIIKRNMKGNNKKQKREQNVELDSSTFEFNLSSAPSKKASTPAKRKVVKF